jgi:hypothetical protein
METFESALKLIKPFSYFASIDLRHAYYSINMAENDQTILRFQWREKNYQYTCLPIKNPKFCNKQTVSFTLLVHSNGVSAINSESSIYKKKIKHQLERYLES